MFSSLPWEKRHLRWMQHVRCYKWDGLGLDGSLGGVKYRAPTVLIIIIMISSSSSKGQSTNLETYVKLSPPAPNRMNFQFSKKIANYLRKNKGGWKISENSSNLVRAGFSECMCSLQRHLKSSNLLQIQATPINDYRYFNLQNTLSQDSHWKRCILVN